MDELGRPIDPPASPPDRDDANDPQAFSQAKNEQNTRRRLDDFVIQRIMDDRAGRDWMYRKLAACHIYDASVDLGSLERGSDPYATYFFCGERNVGNQLLADVQRGAADQYLLMLKEQNETKAARNG